MGNPQMSVCWLLVSQEVAAFRAKYREKTAAEEREAALERERQRQRDIQEQLRRHQQNIQFHQQVCRVVSPWILWCLGCRQCYELCVLRGGEF